MEDTNEIYIRKIYKINMCNSFAVLHKTQTYKGTSKSLIHSHKPVLD